MTELEHAIKHIKTRADAWAVKEVTEALRSISVRMDKALSQEPCDDAISREAVLNMQYRIDDSATLSTRDVVNVEDIEDLPSVTQKSGKWILLDECANSGYYCSNCQKKLVKEGWSNTVKKIKFCPNCGAKMESEG